MAKRVPHGMLTPQAAPETTALRRMRYLWMVLCAALALGVIAIRPVVGLFGHWGALAVFGLTLATPLHGLAYFRRKNAADEAYAARDAL